MGERIYEVPESIMQAIITLISELPYGKIAPLAAAVGALLDEQNKRFEAEKSKKD